MLAFVHIPKTAGTTLHKILTHQYQRVFIHHDTMGPASDELASRVRLANPQVFMGHFSVGLHRFIPEIRYITCLREPVARIVSHYHHALNEPAHYLHQQVHEHKLSITDYVSSGISGELSNGMTRMLAGVEDFHHATVDEQTLARAKTNLETLFAGVVLSESFDAGVLMLADSLGWNTPYYIRRKVGRYRGSTGRPDESARKLIMDNNRFDCELHAWASERFVIQTESTPDLYTRVRRFQQANRRYGKAIFCLRELKRIIRR